ncbi:MAG: PilZ domain-containing protein [Bacillota bacterium]|nr:PilZ domain-containing protein [Bacillota bacterium]MDW7682749.1 PilZ domain-containing protein [Bacillota bacterium]
MPVTIGGALRQKIIFTGKQVMITGDKASLECRGKIVEIEGDMLILELFATTVYPHEMLRQQKAVNVSFVVSGDATYSFAADVSSYNDTAHILQIRQASPMERTDKRKFYRLKTSKLVYIVSETEQGESWLQAGLLDISRGGASILSPVPVSCGSDLKVWIPLDEVDHVIETVSRVVRVLEGDEGQVIAGVSFEGLSLTDQEKILDYILKVWKEKKNEEH